MQVTSLLYIGFHCERLGEAIPIFDSEIQYIAN